MKPPEGSPPTRLLPTGFEALETWAPEFALASEPERNARRLASTMPALTAFYEALAAHMEPILKHLDARPLERLEAPERRLLHLALMFMEVSPAVELFHRPAVPDAFPMHRFEILQA